MGKSYELPKVEEVAIVVNKDEIQNTTKVAGNAAPAMTLATIYTKGIDELSEFAAGKLGFANLAARQEKSLEFVKLLDNLLKQDYADVRTCLRHLLRVIGANPEPFVSGSVYATLFTLKKIPYGIDVSRYIETMTFFASLQENIRNAGRFVAARDLPTIFKDWRREERDKLIMFANSYNN